MNVIVVVGAASFLLLLAFTWLVWKLISSTRVREFDPGWYKDFSVERYRPLERLLSDDDVRFLKSQPGYEPGMEKTLRRERRRVLRSYLKVLGRDFNRLHGALRLVVLYAPEEQSDLATTLVKQKMVFFASLAMVHMRLCLHGLGLSSVDVRDLLVTLEDMRDSLQTMVESPAGPVSSMA